MKHDTWSSNDVVRAHQVVVPLHGMLDPLANSAKKSTFMALTSYLPELITSTGRRCKRDILYAGRVRTRFRRYERMVIEWLEWEAQQSGYHVRHHDNHNETFPVTFPHLLHWIAIVLDVLYLLLGSLVPLFHRLAFLIRNEGS
jgi:hypothetical protein